jgi:beta-lactamase regulating signal transducer with metallopeptidase domain
MSQFAPWKPGNTAILATIQILVQITVVVLIAMGLDRLLARRPASARHTVWLCTLLITLAGPAIFLASARMGVTMATISWASSEPFDSAPAGMDAGASTTDSLPIASASIDRPAPSQPPLASRPMVLELDDHSTDAGVARVEPVDELRPSREFISDRPEPLTPAPTRDAVSILRAIEGGIVAAWLIGMAVLFVRLVRGLVVLAALRGSARPIGAESLRTVLDEVRAGLGTARLPAILESPRVAGPVATGVLRPAVILPEGLTGSIPHAGLRDILIHNADYRIMSTEALAIWFFGPFPGSLGFVPREDDAA